MITVSENPMKHFRRVIRYISSNGKIGVEAHAIGEDSWDDDEQSKGPIGKLMPKFDLLLAVNRIVQELHKEDDVADASPQLEEVDLDYHWKHPVF
jgi:hypothetical protein